MNLKEKIQKILDGDTDRKYMASKIYFTCVCHYFDRKNNGWTKIESVKDLPDLKNQSIIFFRKNITTTYYSEDVSEDRKYFLKYTHFRIKEKFKNPE